MNKFKIALISFTLGIFIISILGLMTSRIQTFAPSQQVPSATLNSMQDGTISISTAFIRHNEIISGGSWDGSLTNDSTSGYITLPGQTTAFTGHMNVFFQWRDIVTGGGQKAILQNSTDGVTWYGLASTQSLQTTAYIGARAIETHYALEFAGTFTANRTTYRILCDEGVLLANGTHFAWWMQPSW